MKIAFSGPKLIENLFHIQDISPLLGLNRSHIFKVFEKFKDVLDKLEIRSLIVFEGIHCNNYDKKYKTLLYYYPSHIWENLANNKMEEAEKLVKQDWQLTFPIEQLYSVLDNLNIEFMVGPYNHLAQISWLLKYDYVNAVYCELEALMYVNIKQMIYHIDLDSLNFLYIERKSIMNLFHTSVEGVKFPFLIILFQIGDMFLFGGYLTNS